MATILDKDLTRETTVLVNDRNIVITLTESQDISFKLKGMKTGTVSISILDVYKQLTAGEELEVKSGIGSINIKRTENKSIKDDSLISLNDLRSMNMISELDYATKSKLDELILTVINNNK